MSIRMTDADALKSLYGGPIAVSVPRRKLDEFDLIFYFRVGGSVRVETVTDTIKSFEREIEMFDVEFFLVCFGIEAELFDC